MDTSFSFCRGVPVSIPSRNQSKKDPYSIGKCAVTIFDTAKIQKIKLIREDTGFVDI